MKLEFLRKHRVICRVSYEGKQRYGAVTLIGFCVEWQWFSLRR